MTAKDVRDAIKKRFSDGRQFAIAEEVGITTGGGCRRLDMIVIDCYSSNGFRVDGFEIKVSKADLRRELQDPDKHCDFFDVIDFYTIAAPAEVVNQMIDVIPSKWGILTVNDDGSTRYKRKPLALRDEKTLNRSVPRGFFASVVRSIQGREPASQEINDAFNRGYEKGKSSMTSRFDYERDRVQRNLEKIEAYEKMMYRFHIWRHDNIDEILDEFEAYRNLNAGSFRDGLVRMIKNCQELINKLTPATSAEHQEASGKLPDDIGSNIDGKEKTK